jgi:hypothetical protein
MVNGKSERILLVVNSTFTRRLYPFTIYHSLFTFKYWFPFLHISSHPFLRIFRLKELLLQLTLSTLAQTQTESQRRFARSV